MSCPDGTMSADTFGDAQMQEISISCCRRVMEVQKENSSSVPVPTESTEAGG